MLAPDSEQLMPSAVGNKRYPEMFCNKSVMIARMVPMMIVATIIILIIIIIAMIVVIIIIMMITTTTTITAKHNK